MLLNTNLFLTKLKLRQKMLYYKGLLAKGNFSKICRLGSTKIIGLFILLYSKLFIIHFFIIIHYSVCRASIVLCCFSVASFPGPRPTFPSQALGGMRDVRSWYFPNWNNNKMNTENQRLFVAIVTVEITSRRTRISVWLWRVVAYRFPNPPSMWLWWSSRLIEGAAGESQ